MLWQPNLGGTKIRAADISICIVISHSLMFTSNPELKLVSKAEQKKLKLFFAFPSYFGFHRKRFHIVMEESSYDPFQNMQHGMFPFWNAKAFFHHNLLDEKDTTH